MARTIYRERIPSTDGRLRRHILHDSEAWRYPFDTRGLTIASVEHRRILPILDQADVGKCTAETGLGLLGTKPYACVDVNEAWKRAFGSLDDVGTDRLYNAEQNLDGDGPYPPNDHGSTGLTLAKVLRAAGLISGWTQTFTLDDFLKALTRFPIAVGTYWYQSMFKPDRTGLVAVDPTSGIAGGHEYECVGYSTATGLVKFANSWGEGWGDRGYFYMRASMFGKLLADKGDATIFTPISQPAPVPTPVKPVPSAADLKLNAQLGDWPDGYHLSASAQRVAHALQTWRIEEGLDARP